jgi:hypothetical protein
MMTKNEELVEAVVGVLFVLAMIAVVLVYPFAVIASLNTLFPVLAIPYTFWTWIAVVVITGVFKTNVNVKKS